MAYNDELQWKPGWPLTVAVLEIGAVSCWVCKRHQPDGTWFVLVLAAMFRFPLLAVTEDPDETEAVEKAIVEARAMLSKQRA